MLESPPLPDRVAESLLERIRGGDLRPGDFLPSSRELEQQFGVSRIVIREALRVLAAKGVVRVYQGKGAQVCPANPSQMTEALNLLLLGQSNVWPNLMEVRQILEGAAVDLAAQRRTAEDLEGLVQALDGMAKTLADAAAFADWDIIFHQRLVKSAHNPVLDLVTQPIGELLRASRLAILNPRRAALSEALRDQHRAIYDAVEQQDGPAAAVAMRAHLERVAWNMWQQLGQATQTPVRTRD